MWLNPFLKKEITDYKRDAKFDNDNVSYIYYDSEKSIKAVISQEI